jgi:hypothetical protein
MLIAGQFSVLRLLHHLHQELSRHVPFQQSVPVLGEHCDVPDRLVHIHSDEPSEEHAVVDLFHQQALAAHRIQHLDELRPEQLLWRDRRASSLGVHRVEPRRHVG